MPSSATLAIIMSIPSAFYRSAKILFTPLILALHAQETSLDCIGIYTDKPLLSGLLLSVHLPYADLAEIMDGTAGVAYYSL